MAASLEGPSMPERKQLCKSCGQIARRAFPKVTPTTPASSAIAHALPTTCPELVQELSRSRDPAQIYLSRCLPTGSPMLANLDRDMEQFDQHRPMWANLLAEVGQT